MTVPVPPGPRAEPRCIYCCGPLGDFDLLGVCIRCDSTYLPLVDQPVNTRPDGEGKSHDQ